MARRTHVPKFGNWDANDHMPFTAVFDNARHGRGKPINPNDPSDNSDIFGGSGPNAGAAGRRIFNPNDPEDVDTSDLHHQDRPGSGGGRDGGNSRGQPPRTGYDQQVRRQGPPVGRNNPMPPSRPAPTDYNKRQGSRENLVTDRHLESPSPSFSADQSPPHAAGGNPVKKPAGAGMVGGGSPAWERKKSSGEEAPTFAPATPTRSRLRAGNTKPEDSLQKGSAALPKFGTWNQDPGSGDGFTVIFNQARNERKAGGPVRIPQAGDSSHDQDLYHQEHVLKRDANKKWFCCFSPVVNA